MEKFVIDFLKNSVDEDESNFEQITIKTYTS